MPADPVEEAVDRLYGLPLEEFVPERGTTAKALRKAGEKEAAAQVAKLPKPSQVAWTANMLAREGADELLEAGEALREAQLGGGGRDAVREAAAAERDAVDALLARAADLRPLSRDATDRLRTLLHAVAADEELREQFAAGRLVAEPEPGGGWPGMGGFGLAPSGPAPASRGREGRASTGSAKAGGGRKAPASRGSERRASRGSAKAGGGREAPAKRGGGSAAKRGGKAAARGAAARDDKREHRAQERRDRERRERERKAAERAEREAARRREEAERRKLERRLANARKRLDAARDRLEAARDAYESAADEVARIEEQMA